MRGSGRDRKDAEFAETTHNSSPPLHTRKIIAAGWLTMCHRSARPGFGHVGRQSADLAGFDMTLS
jgi:hypothetical protein